MALVVKEMFVSGTGSEGDAHLWQDYVAHACVPHDMKGPGLLVQWCNRCTTERLSITYALKTVFIVHCTEVAWDGLFYWLLQNIGSHCCGAEH